MNLLISGLLGEEKTISNMDRYDDMIFVGMAFAKMCRAMKISPRTQITKIDKALTEIGRNTGELYPKEELILCGKWYPRFPKEG